MTAPLQIRTGAAAIVIATMFATLGCQDAFAPYPETTDSTNTSELEGSQGAETDPGAEAARADSNTAVAGEASEDARRGIRRSRQFERDVVELVNERRAEGADCGEHGSMDPAPPLQEDSRLRIAAFGHSRYMAANDVMAHEGRDGSRFYDRTTEAKYSGVARGENVAGGYPDPGDVVEGWMTSDGHCLVAMLPETDEIGVGYTFADETTYGHFWTMVVGQAHR